MYSELANRTRRVVLGRYYIDNWIMGSIQFKHGILVDTTDSSRFLARL